MSDQMCVICRTCRDGAVEFVYMSHGIAIQLCGSHAHPRYLLRSCGETFTRALERVWAAAGALTKRRQAALEHHRRRARTPHPGPPGSYAWPDLRSEAERRFASGEDPTTVITQIRSRPAPSFVRLPSVRTMRRWFSQARWRTPPDPRPPRPPRRRLPRLNPLGLPEITGFGIWTDLIFEPHPHPRR